MPLKKSLKFNNGIDSKEDAHQTNDSYGNEKNIHDKMDFKINISNETIRIEYKVVAVDIPSEYGVSDVSPGIDMKKLKFKQTFVPLLTENMMKQVLYR